MKKFGHPAPNEDLKGEPVVNWGAITALILDKAERRQQANGGSAQDDDDPIDLVAIEQSIHNSMDIRTAVVLAIFGGLLFSPIKDGVPIISPGYITVMVRMCVSGALLAIISIAAGRSVFVHPKRRRELLNGDSLGRMYLITLRKAITYNLSLAHLAALFVLGGLAMS